MLTGAVCVLEKQKMKRRNEEKDKMKEHSITHSRNH